MDIKIIASHKNIYQATGLTVIIDVLRAFSTACFLLKNKARRIIPVEIVEQAYELKKKHPDYILIGERNGFDLLGFDYSNSPFSVKDIDFSNKTIVMCTTAGTKGIIKSVNAKEIITGSFVNCNAVVNHIKKTKNNTVTLVCTNDKYDDNEDFMCAAYIKSRLEGKPLNFQIVKNHLIRHPISYGFLRTPLTKYAREDFYLCMELDKFDFVIKAKRDKNSIYLEKM